MVGVVTGVGEAAALGLRLVSGPLADRSRRFWAWTIAGYTLTVVTVPLLGIAGALWVACALVIAERVGKAVRGPAKDTLLSHAASVTGRGRGFAVHEALDQVGAMIGPHRCRDARDHRECLCARARRADPARRCRPCSVAVAAASGAAGVLRGLSGCPR